MTQTEQSKAAKKFSEDWKDKGYEKGESQKFWLDLLCNVFGIKDFANLGTKIYLWASIVTASTLGCYKQL